VNNVAPTVRITSYLPSTSLPAWNGFIVYEGQPTLTFQASATDPVQGDRARQLFENIMRQRLEAMGVQQNYVLSSLEDENAICRALQHLLRAKPAVIVVASTTAPQGPEDVVGRAMLRLGTHIERFLAPVEPGSLMMLGYKDDIPILSAPGCYRSAKKNVLDIILPPLLARYRMSGWEIASLGHGGLLI
jgi:molybdenum cofactor cytidylyltransferase